MKKYLLWSRFPFMENVSLMRILRDNLVQSNSGNLAFHTSIVRTLMTEGTTFRSIFPMPAQPITARQIEEYNSYDAFIIPLANAFRSDYLPFLRMLTDLVRQLRIPCIVTSVGIQFANDQGPETVLPFDEEVRRFVSAVLDHSSVLGLRGEVTGAYLNRLGFREGSHYSVTGCPSMYYFGSRFPRTRALKDGNDLKVYMYSKLDSTKEIHEFIGRSCEALPNYSYVAQLLRELKFMAYAIPNDKLSGRSLPAYYPLNRYAEAYHRNAAVGFTDFPAWIEEMRGADLCYGCNIHGTVPALLAGTPAIVIERDRRVAEIARFYDIPTVRPEQLERMRDIREAFEHADHSIMYKNYAARFERFLRFLEGNGLEHIYSGDPMLTEAPWDRFHASIGHAAPIRFDGSFTASEKLQGMLLRVENIPLKLKKAPTKQ